MSKNVSDDLALVSKAKTKDAKAFEKLMKKYHKSVYYMLLKMVNNTDDAQRSEERRVGKECVP